MKKGHPGKEEKVKALIQMKKIMSDGEMADQIIRRHLPESCSGPRLNLIPSKKKKD